MRKHVIWLLVGLLCLLLIFFGLRGCDSSNTPKWAMNGVNAQGLTAAGDSDPESAPSDQPTQDAASPASSDQPTQDAASPASSDQPTQDATSPASSDQPIQDTSSPAPAEEAAQTPEPSQAPAATPATSDAGTSDTSPVVGVTGENTSTVDGQPAEETGNESSDKPASSSEPANTPENADRELSVIDPYMRGEDVKNLQDMLIAKGYDPGKADGIYGPKTERAVKMFQSAEKLYSESDAQFGVVDAATWQSLRGGKAQ